MTITELAIKRPTLIVVIFAVLGVLGLFSYSQLSYDLLPKISAPVVTISTIYPGASPSEVETGVTKLVEDAVAGIDKISALRSTSYEGNSFVVIEFEQAAKIDVVLQDVQRKVGEIGYRLPNGSKTPVVSKIALDEIPVLRIGVTSNMPSKEFYQFLKDRVQPRLSKIAGVGQVALSGGDEREIKINLDSRKLQAYGLSIMQVTNAIKAANMDVPTGKVKDREQQFVVRVAGKINSIEQLRNLVVARSKQGGDVRLADVAEVQDGVKDISILSRVNGVSSVGMQVVKQSEANAVQLSNVIRKELAQIEKEFASTGIKFDIAQDGSTFTREAADAVKHDLMLAVILVAFVMLIFLHSLRNSLIVMVAIPASLISTFIGMYAFGFTLNLMTLLAMSLVIGILVDDSIVVLENIHRHLEMKKEPRTAALDGRNEIGFSALSITLVDVVVFLPLSLVSGLVGNILREFAVVVVVSTLLSLFVSFTVTPLLASRFSRADHLTKGTLMGRFGIMFESFFDKVTVHYQGVLRWALGNPWKTVGFIALAFVGSLALAPLGFIGFEFMPQADRGEFTVTVELPSGVAVEQTNQVSLRIERMLAEMPEIKKVFTNAGMSSDGLLGFASNNNAELNVALVPPEQRTRTTDEVGQEIKRRVSMIPGAKVRVNPIGIFGTANQTPIMIAVGGTNLADIQNTANMFMDTLKAIPGTADVRLSSESGKPELRIDIDREKATALGLSVAEVGASLRTALTGNDDSKFRDGDTEYDIRIQLDQFDRSRTADVSGLTFFNNRGQAVALKQFASVYYTTGPTKLQRQDRVGVLYVYSQALGRPSGNIVADFKARVAKMHIPDGISIAYLGDEKNRAEGFGSLGLALLAAILFVYLIMVALYDSYVYPFVVLFSIPVALIGALLALALLMKSLSIFTILGLIMLVGLVAKNAILLVDRTNQMKAEGFSVKDALIEAGGTRLRPIMMTTFSMVIGMLPIGLSTASGSEWKSGLAWGLIGGLTSSMFLTLILVPVVYTAAEWMREKVPAFFAAPSGLLKDLVGLRRKREDGAALVK